MDHTEVAGLRIAYHRASQGHRWSCCAGSSGTAGERVGNRLAAASRLDDFHPQADGRTTRRPRRQTGTRVCSHDVLGLGSTTGVKVEALTAIAAQICDRKGLAE